MQVNIYVCRHCGYWPINGEEHRPKCKGCSKSAWESIDPDNLHSLLSVYRRASGIQELVPRVIGR